MLQDEVTGRASAPGEHDGQAEGTAVGTHRAQPGADASTLRFIYTFTILQSICPTDNIIHVNASQLPSTGGDYK
ncbi:hypothetical protein JOB18_018372 [Solea senegalensis]|uniref:Uncharacterized protein n=1 Tax=Solea senegalensis TaxID=28829 RepID=A0AAV6Q1N6_SOLSE|nr:hypothetical protein JOB18_018372 [Solea senegalensis]